MKTIILAILMATATGCMTMPYERNAKLVESGELTYRPADPNGPKRVPIKGFQLTDYECLNECTSYYSYGLCEKKCSY